MKKIVLSLVVVVGVCASSLVAAKKEALLILKNNTNEPAYFKIKPLKKSISGTYVGKKKPKLFGSSVYKVKPRGTFKGKIRTNRSLLIRALKTFSTKGKQVPGAKIKIGKGTLKKAKRSVFVRYRLLPHRHSGELLKGRFEVGYKRH